MMSDRDVRTGDNTWKKADPEFQVLYRVAIDFDIQEIMREFNKNFFFIYVEVCLQFNKTQYLCVITVWRISKKR